MWADGRYPHRMCARSFLALCFFQEPAIEFVRQQQAAAQAAAEQTTELSAADVQGLIFGGGGPSRPKNDPRL